MVLTRKKLLSQIALGILTLFSLQSKAGNIEVGGVKELKSVLPALQPGDTVFLLPGIYKDAGVEIRKGGANGKPVVIAAKTPGSVKFTGDSWIKFGADHVVVSGIHFTDGYCQKGAIIEFRVNDKMIASDCRLTNSVIENFSKPERFDGDSWIIFWGKRNRIDHCLIGEKYNSGTTLIVNLNDERSQNNNHSIDSNYFRGRPRLGANGGETIRVGVSRYSLTASETKIHHNYFERCNGEVEIISLKSGKNTVSDNLFFESEGGLVLRHGSDNIIKNNIFLGNGKPFTGGIRVINPGHTVSNNLLVGLAGERFHAGFSVLNGVPNSAINRYAQVQNVEISNNTFVDCASILFGAGKDPERTAPPADVRFINNLLTTKYDILFEDLNNDGGISFSNNICSGPSIKSAPKGFKIEPKIRTKQIRYGDSVYSIPYAKNGADLNSLHWITRNSTCPSWYRTTESGRRSPQTLKVSAKDASRLSAIVADAVDGDRIELADTGVYKIEVPMSVSKKLTITSAQGLSLKPELICVASKTIPGFIVLENGADLTVENIRFTSSTDSYGAAATGITTTTAPMNRAYKLRVDGCVFTGYNETGFSCIRGTKSTLGARVEIENSIFINNSGSGLEYSAERDDKGYYNVEELYVRNCVFSNMLNSAINVYRGGNDESTTGPLVVIDHCTFNEVDNRMQGCVVKLLGVQQASVLNSVFNKSGSGGRSIWFEEMAWDKLKVDFCNFYESGRVTSFFNNLNTTKTFSENPLFRDVQNTDFRITESKASLKSASGVPIGVDLVYKDF